jgi:hypothetical protein
MLPTRRLQCLLVCIYKFLYIDGKKVDLTESIITGDTLSGVPRFSANDTHKKSNEIQHQMGKKQNTRTIHTEDKEYCIFSYIHT